MPSVLNIAAYQFTPISDLAGMKAALRKQATELGIKGTILLAPEGINLFMAGEPGCVKKMVDFLKGFNGLENIIVKESCSDEVPFEKLMVKIKKEIISFRQPDIKPGESTSPRISPAQLKQWLDEGRELILLDTRNTYETQWGTFENAVTMPLKDFTHFAGAASQHLPPKESSTPIITFCTGGIRCEKAAPYLEKLGYQNVYQLDGGILNYFEQEGGSHYQGACWVFDQRTAVNPDLSPVPLEK